MSKILPVFTSHYSIKSSILTLDAPKEVVKNGPESIINLAVQNNFKELYLVENNLSGIITAYKNCKENNISLRFGLKLVMCNNMNDKSAESLESEHKIIIFCKNASGYKRLLKIYSKAATDGFYYRPRLDSKTLKEFWNSKDLSLVHPFYYSFLHRNLLYPSTCRPNYNFATNRFFIEENSLPFNYLLQDAINKLINGKNVELIPIQSIYYSREEDFKAFLVYRCILSRTNLNKPNQDHLCSNEFSFENWLKRNQVQ